MCYKLAFVTLAFLIGGSLHVSSQTQPPPPAAPQQKKEAPTTFGPEFKRWFDIEVFTLSTRYQFIRNNAGVDIANHQQWLTQFRPRLKFDKNGRYSVVAFISTGNAFNGSWNNLGPGTGKLQSNLYVKHLFFDAKPSKKVEIQFGGIEINRGENTEIVTFDNDGYITGERLIVRHPKAAWFDEISVTNAFLGDLNHPSIFGRLHRLNESNYGQLLIRKQVTKEVGLSADYTYFAGADIFHQAVRVRPKDFLFTTLLFEAYQRVATRDGYGFDLFGERVVNKKFLVNGGFARLDRFITLNADRFPPGKRVYASFVYKPNKEFSFQPIIINGVGRLPASATPRTRLDLVLTWNILETLRRHRVL